MGILGDIWDKATDFGHWVTGTPTAAERREQKSMMEGQLNAYKEQTELTRAEIARKRKEEMAEKRRVNEKQIRMIRRGHSRSPGLLGSSDTQSTQAGMSEKLGG